MSYPPLPVLKSLPKTGAKLSGSLASTSPTATFDRSEMPSLLSAGAVMMILVICLTLLELCEPRPVKLVMDDYGSQGKFKRSKNKNGEEFKATLPIDLLFGDQLPPDYKPKDHRFFVHEAEPMDAASLLELIKKLKEEYVKKASGIEAEKVRGSFEKIEETLKAIKAGISGRPDATAATLALLTEEGPEEFEEGVAYEDYYNDMYADDEEDGGDEPDPTLLELQAWTKKLLSKRD